MLFLTEKLAMKDDNPSGAEEVAALNQIICVLTSRVDEQNERIASLLAKEDERIASQQAKENERIESLLKENEQLRKAEQHNRSLKPASKVDLNKVQFNW